MANQVKGIQWLILSLIGVSILGVILIATFTPEKETKTLFNNQTTTTSPMGINFQTFTFELKSNPAPSETGITQTPKANVYPPTIIPSSITPFFTSTPEYEGNIYHIVGNSETINTISSLYRITDEELRANNWMHGNAILPGQKLLIIKGKDWLPQHLGYSIQKGEMLSAYPLSLERPRFTLHYIPQTYPAVDPEAFAKLFENGLSNDEKLFGLPLKSRFDVYATGLFYAIPEQNQRGHSYSKDLYITFLHDGSGDAVDQQYLAAHEMTHLYMWNTFGQPFSFLLSEGAAVYAGKSLIASSNYVPLEQFCKAFLLAGKLPIISDKELTYLGQNYDLDNYYAAGCFVKYLIEMYGVEKLGKVYSSNDFLGVYGKSLPDLENEWHIYLKRLDLKLTFEVQELISVNDGVKSAYHRFFADIFTRPDMVRPYLLLDQARLAELKLHFSEANDLLDQYQEAIK